MELQLRPKNGDDSEFVILEYPDCQFKCEENKDLEHWVQMHTTDVIEEMLGQYPRLSLLDIQKKVEKKSKISVNDLDIMNYRRIIPDTQIQKTHEAMVQYFQSILEMLKPYGDNYCRFSLEHGYRLELDSNENSETYQLC